MPELAKQGRFRQASLDRLAFDVIRIPPLRERQPDILLLAEHFAILMCGELKRSHFTGFTHDAQQTLQQYPWPGNVRELKNVIQRSVYRHGDRAEPVNNIIF
ncbi:hypothetical protein AB6F55_16215 [Providencia hangzhouensis]